MKNYEPLDNHQRDWLCDVEKLGDKPPFAYIWNPIYGFGLMFTWDTDEERFNQLVNHYANEKPKKRIFLPKRGGKFLANSRSGDMFIAVTKHRSKPDQFEVMAHEAYHLVDDVIRDSQGVRGKEAMAYAIGWVMGRMVHMMELYKFRKNSLKKSCIRRANRHRSNPNRKKP